MLAKKRVEFISIGDELLSGVRTNTHLTYLGEKLLRCGLPLIRSCEIRDEPEEMEEQIRLSLERCDLLIISGGLGPTSDDLTVDAVAEVLGRQLYHDPQVEAAIRAFFERRGRTPTDNNFRQCRVLQGATVLPNPNGTAPGQWIDNEGQVIVLLPGPPNELMPLFEHEVIPLLVEHSWVDETLTQIHLRTVGIGESMVAKLLDPVLEPYRKVIRVAYCAHLSHVDVRLTASSRSIEESDLLRIGECCRKTLGNGFLCYGEGDLPAIILEHLREQNKTLAVAESCTGGLLASRFTDVPGASKTFKGGVICYRNEIKETLLQVPACLLAQHGAVSAECSVALATGVADLMEADYALAITGYAGPDGGSDPAGTVYIGFSSPMGVWSRKAVLPGSRIAVKERATTLALDFMRQKLEQFRMHVLLDQLRCR